MAESFEYSNGSLGNASIFLTNETLSLLHGSDVPIKCNQNLATTRFVVQLILVPLLSTFGVIGNVINVVVLTRRWMRSSTNFYLTALAVYDILYLTLLVCLTLKYYPDIVNSPSYTYFYEPWGRPLADICSNTATWLTVTFTVERYIAVCYPMRGKVLCTPQRARWIIVAVCVAAFGITCPEFFAVVVKKDPTTNTTRKFTTEFGERKSYTVGYTWTNSALFSFAPLVLLSIFNSLLVKSVWKAAQIRKAMAGASSSDSRQERHTKEQTRITIMLISVVLVFLLCQMPSAIVNVYTATVAASRDFTEYEVCTLRISGNILNFLVQINSTTNFILYSYFSTKFRKTFKRLLCSCLGKDIRQENIFSDIHMSKIQHGSKTNLVVTTNANSRSVTPRGSRASLEPNGNKKNKNGYLQVPVANDGKVAV